MIDVACLKALRMCVCVSICIPELKIGEISLKINYVRRCSYDSYDYTLLF